MANGCQRRMQASAIAPQSSADKGSKGINKDNIKICVIVNFTYRLKLVVDRVIY